MQRKPKVAKWSILTALCAILLVASVVANFVANTYATTINANTTVYAVYEEQEFDVTVSAGSNGSVSPTGTVSVSYYTGTTLTATPNSNYVFKDWTISGGDITPTSSSTASQLFNAQTTGGTIRANFFNQ